MELREVDSGAEAFARLREVGGGATPDTKYKSGATSTGDLDFNEGRRFFGLKSEVSCLISTGY